MGFWRMDGGRKMKEWVWRQGEGWRWSKTWWMELWTGVDGWIWFKED